LRHIVEGGKWQTRIDRCESVLHLVRKARQITVSSNHPAWREPGMRQHKGTIVNLIRRNVDLRKGIQRTVSTPTDFLLNVADDADDLVIRVAAFDVSPERLGIVAQIAP